MSNRITPAKANPGGPREQRHHLKPKARVQAPESLHGAWIPSAMGLVVSAYLWSLDLFGSAAFCLTKYGCDLVRQSAYGKILGVPVAAYGVLFFSVVLGLALTRTAWRDRWLAVLVAAGAGVSLVFLVLQLAVIRAVCPYCLVAEAAAFALAYLVLRGRPRAAQARAGMVGLIVAGVLIATYALGVIPSQGNRSDEAAYAAGLARHLTQTGVEFYGAYWCPHCRDQKTLFGSAAALLPYVECDPKGSHGQPGRCQARGIRVYPTWDFHGELVEGVQSLDELARRSGYPPR